ncbi:MAG: sn-glycerol-3-phosphate ABC transporter substrate-binding protein UgpB [Rhodospirillales bacterium]
MRKVILGATLAVGLGVAGTASAQQRVQIEFWHGLTPIGSTILEQLATDFNASQSTYQVNAAFKGIYPETMAATIAAFRAGTAPHIVQMFEVGTGTMMAAGRAVKPLHELLSETGVQIDINDYVPGIRGYYALPDGRQMSMPFNSSTTVMFYNKDAFQKAGLDPEKAPETWPQLVDAARKLKAAGVACPFTTAWPTWAQVENFSAIHNIPIATQENGFAGLNAELRINNPTMVRHLNTLVEMQKEGLFRYGGRDSAADALFPSGECAIIHASSGLRGRIVREAEFKWGVGMLPYYPDVAGAPFNSIIGGASFWVMNKGSNAARSAPEWMGIAEFFRFLAQPEVAAMWHRETGFMPVRVSAYEAVKASGFYQQNPGADVPILQMLRGPGTTTENTRGIRLGGFPEIRVIMQEEMERAFQGQQTAQQALDNAVTRGNVVLRNFERANRS